jgi:hypothetical protein
MGINIDPMTAKILQYLATGEEAPPSGTIPNYTEPEPTPTPAAQPAAPYEPSREYPPSASEIPQAPAPAPPHPASMWPPTLLYDPWAPQQATDETMGANLGLGRPAFSPAFVGANNPMAAINADPRMEWLAAQQQGAGQWQPPQQDWLGINWGGQEPPPAPGPLPEPRQERTGLGQPWQPPQQDWLGINWGGQEPPSAPPGAADNFLQAIVDMGNGTLPPAPDQTGPGHYNVQLPPGAAPGPPAPPPLMGTPPPGDQLEPGHYRVTLPGTPTPPAEPNPQVRPARHPEAPYGGADFESMLNYMLEQSRAGETAAAAPAPTPPTTRRTEAEPSEEAERQGREPVRSRWGPDTRSVLWTGQSQRKKYDRAREDFHNAYMDRFRAMQQGYGADFGAATAQVWNARKAGATPYQQQIMARRMAIMASGMPTSSYLPGT